MAGMLPSKKPRVADDRHVGREAVAVGLEPGVEVDRARLLLALEDVAHVDREAAAGREDGRRGHQVDVDLALVVGRATGRASDRRRRPARTAATSTGRAGRPAGRRSGRRRGPSARPGRAASRRRRRDGRRSRRPRRARGRRRVSASASHSAARTAVGRVAGQCRDARDPEELLVRGSGARRASRRGGPQGGGRSRSSGRTWIESAWRRSRGQSTRLASESNERAVAGPLASGDWRWWTPAQAGCGFGSGDRLAGPDDRRDRRAGPPSAACR